MGCFIACAVWRSESCMQSSRTTWLAKYNWLYWSCFSLNDIYFAAVVENKTFFLNNNNKMCTHDWLTHFIVFPPTCHNYAYFAFFMCPVRDWVKYCIWHKIFDVLLLFTVIQFYTYKVVHVCILLLAAFTVCSPLLSVMHCIWLHYRKVLLLFNSFLDLAPHCQTLYYLFMHFETTWDLKQSLMVLPRNFVII